MALRSIGTVGGIGVTKSSGMPQTREASTLDVVINLQIVVESVRWIAVFCRRVPGSCRRFRAILVSIAANDAPQEIKPTWLGVAGQGIPLFSAGHLPFAVSQRVLKFAKWSVFRRCIVPHENHNFVQNAPATPRRDRKGQSGLR